MWTFLAIIEIMGNYEQIEQFWEIDWDLPESGGPGWHDDVEKQTLDIEERLEHATGTMCEIICWKILKYLKTSFLKS